MFYLCRNSEAYPYQLRCQANILSYIGPHMTSFFTWVHLGCILGTCMSDLQLKYSNIESHVAADYRDGVIWSVTTRWCRVTAAVCSLCLMNHAMPNRDTASTRSSSSFILVRLPTSANIEYFLDDLLAAPLPVRSTP